MTEYTGELTVDGPPQVRELDGLRITKIAVGRMNNNAYLLTCTSTGAQLLIDAAAQPERLLELIGPAGLKVIVTTHRHWDHTGALERVAAATGASLAAGELDADDLPTSIDARLTDGDSITFGHVRLQVLSVPGHTPGGIVLAYAPAGEPAHLFTGDSLFPGGVGATSHYPYQSFPQLIDAVESQLFDRFADDTWVYPGHGGDTTLGAERPQLAQWRERGW